MHICGSETQVGYNESRVIESVPQLPGDMSEFPSGANVRTTFYLHNFFMDYTEIWR